LHRFLAPVAFAVAAGCLLSCDGAAPAPSHPVRDCSHALWIFAPEASSVSVSGTWTQWAATPVPSAGQGWFKTVLSLSAGEHGYLLYVDGKPRLDERNALTTFRGEEEVSLLLVPDCTVPQVRVDEVQTSASGEVTIAATFLAATAGGPLDPASITAATRSGTQLAVKAAEPSTGRFSLTARDLSRGKYTFTLQASDTAGRAAEAARAGAWVNAVAPGWHDALVYQLVVDRFRGPGGSVLAAPSTPGHRAGGTLEGVRAELEKGTFEQLGVGVLWLSPVYLNPQELREGSGGHMYEGYHGYWPLEGRTVEPRLGGEEALEQLVESAHRRGIRVLLDIVPNHVYEKNPRYLEHQGTGWFHDKCVCGSAPCPWSTHIGTCWFVDYLPDYRFEEPGAMQLAVDDTVWWTERFGTDGVRIDAVPMMPRATTRRIAHGLRSGWFPSNDQLLLGEVFTGGGASGIANIRYFMGPDGLDSAFDFPLMWAMREVLAKGKAGFGQVEEALRDTEIALEGSGAVLARIIGNHDTSRFLSEAVGDGAADPWGKPAVQPEEPTAYRRQAMAMAMLLTLPGMPVLYYGDEAGLAGAGDPDCRRVMPEEAALSQPRLELLEQTRRLGRFRACSAALRRGSRVALQVRADSYVYRRDAGDGWPVLVLVSKAATALDIEVSGNVLPPGVYRDVVTAETLSIGAQGHGPVVQVQPLTARVLVREGHECLSGD
jgi:glycosidase